MGKIYQLILSLMVAIFIAACVGDKELEGYYSNPSQAHGGTVITIDAAMPGHNATSKIGLVQADNSLNVISKWQTDDIVQLFVSQDGNCHSIGKTTVENISADGKTCSFSFMLPAGINPGKTYNVFGLCGVEGSLINGEIIVNASMKRVPLSQMKAPCYFSAQTQSTTKFSTNFVFIGTYEILHVANQSDNGITFSLNGYLSGSKWYNNASRNTLQCGVYSGEIVSSGIDGNPIIEGVSIPSGETATIVSWYLPNGGTITDAKIDAVINGSAVQSSNTKSSAAVIQNGKAYHLYAIWNGKELKFCDRSMQINEEEDQETYWSNSPKEVLTCDYKGKRITLYKQIDLGNYHTNPDGTVFYRTSFFLDTNAGELTLITNDVYTPAFVNNWMSPCMLIEADKDIISIYSSSKDEGEYYSMEGYVFRYDIDTKNISKELVFDYANWGWHSRFDVSDNVVKLNHFSYARYYAMESVRNDDGTWCTQYVGDIYPEDYDKESMQHDIILISLALSTSNYETTNNNNTETSNYDYVDLGLPSGTLWATCNVGAKNPWDYGDYFAWGETKPKDVYSWDNYKYGLSNPYGTITKYRPENATYGYENDVVDNIILLEPSDDAATVNMGQGWRMPTKEECAELADNCNIEWTLNYNNTGISGVIVRSKTKSNVHLFLPALGPVNDIVPYGGVTSARYWSSSVNVNYPFTAHELYFVYNTSSSSNVKSYTNDNGYDNRFCGELVRAVRYKPSDNPNINPGSVSNITIERKYYIHWANNYCSPDFKIIFNDGTQGIRIGYFNESYINEYGLILFDCSDVNSIEQLYNKWNMGSATTDEWVNEKIVLSTDGIVTYYQNGSLLASQSITAWGIEDVKSIKLDFCPYGWWTEHYQYMDDLKITIDGKVIINDQFDYFDYNVWEEPINPDGVRTEDGIMIMSQDRTDEDFHLRSKPISLAN